MAFQGSSTLDRFLTSLAEIVRDRDGRKLQDFLQIEPPLPDIYGQMVDELRQKYPNATKEAELLRRCEGLVPKSKDSSSWSAFPTFMKLYFCFLRDVNVENLLETYDMLKGLLNQCVIALGDSQFGIVVLPTVLYLSKVLAKLAMGLDRRPELVAHLLRLEGDQDESTEKVTLVEKSANVVREAFIKCLTDRSGTPGIHGKPEGKRVGIYLMANLCLKLLFQCGKLRNAEQMFASITAQSPPLKHFPASQRVTYLYYLGRYLLSNNLFFPAQIALQSAYDQCHRQAINQKRLILTYLIACNMILGRFPSQKLLQLPEAEGLADKFIPLRQLIIRGDYIAFRDHLTNPPTTEWFARKGILLPLRNRCEILVWRSLTRKVFIHGGFQGEPQGQAQRGPPPFLYLSKLETAVRWLKTQHQQPSTTPFAINPSTPATDSHYGSQIVSVSPDPDFTSLSGPTKNTNLDLDPSLLQKYADYLCPQSFFTATGQLQQNPQSALIDGPPDSNYTDYELNPYADDHDPSTNDPSIPSPLMREIESILASLLTQGLMRGYLTHKNPRFAIPGARLRGALPTGFPNVWQTIHNREAEDSGVPGWVKPPPAMAFGGGGGAAALGGGGRVVNLSGAKPVGLQ
ncbi:hypothetical protein BJY04DRAFT_228266 [Aspergillus karnatakaensis]|uniref:uncharacterized protein n=1 Tax=Aspergillus karnatakaensis TaxID=1810916 RepID=UPI003CCCC4B2